MAGKMPNIDRTRKRLPVLERKGRLHCCGPVRLFGRYEKLWASGYVGKPQHEAELTEVLIHFKVNGIRRMLNVDHFDTDAILTVNGVRFDVEYDRDTMNLRQMKRKFDKLASVENDVLWICPNETRLRELVRLAPSGLHWFTTFRNALTPHDDVWVNNEGDIESLPCAAASGPLTGTTHPLP